MRKVGGIEQIFDPIRRKWLVVTPEERVRVWFLHLLLTKLGCSQGSIAVEYAFEIASGKKLRADIVVFNPDATPLMVVECKAPEVVLNSEVFRQGSKYNSHFKAKYLLFTNGNQTTCYTTTDFVTYTKLEQLPFLGRTK